MHYGSILSAHLFILLSACSPNHWAVLNQTHDFETLLNPPLRLIIDITVSTNQAHGISSCPHLRSFLPKRKSVFLLLLAALQTKKISEIVFYRSKGVFIVLSFFNLYLCVIKESIVELSCLSAYPFFSAMEPIWTRGVIPSIPEIPQFNLIQISTPHLVISTTDFMVVFKSSLPTFVFLFCLPNTSLFLRAPLQKHTMHISFLVLWHLFHSFSFVTLRV